MKRTSENAKAEAQGYFRECAGAMIDTSLRLIRAKHDLSMELRARNDRRHFLMRKIAKRAIPNISKDTLVNLATTDLREFGAQPSVQCAINKVIEARLDWMDYLWSLVVHPTDRFVAYYNLVDVTLENLREQLCDFLETKVATLERLAPVRAHDAEIAALSARYGKLLQIKEAVDSKHETLCELERLVQSGLWDDFLLGSMRNARNALRERKPAQRFDEHDPVLAWIMSLPETLKDWEVEQAPMTV